MNGRKVRSCRICQLTDDMFDSRPVLLLLIIINQWIGAKSASSHLPTTEQSLHTGAFGHIRPLSYSVHVRAPTIDVLLLPTYHQWTFNASVQFRFRTDHSIDVIYLHAKQLTFANNSRSVTVVDDSNNTITAGRILVHETEELIEIRLRPTLVANRTYVLAIDSYTGIIDAGYGTGVWRSSVTGTGSHVIITQFQFSYARGLFPCIDLPQYRTPVQLTIDHRQRTTALGNMRATSTRTIRDHDSDDEWMRTEFAVSPPLPTYTIAFAIVPDAYRSISRQVGTLVLTLHYNGVAIVDRLAHQLLDYAEYSERMLRETIFDRWPMRTDKIDFVLINEFSVHGMENWGMITLNERYILRQLPTFRLSLIAHELAHHWIGNSATVHSWQHICIQEGLTDHLARTIVRQYFGADSIEWRHYLLDKYIMSMEKEGGTTSGLSASVDPTIGEVSDKCFGKAVFLFDMIETLAGTQLFHAQLAQFVRDHHFRTYTRADLIGRFANVTIDNSVTVADIFNAWFDHAGYPSLFVIDERIGNLHIVQLSQKHISSGRRRHEVDDVLWPIPMMLANNTMVIMRQRDVQLIVVDDSYANVNTDFAFFYRINYDANTWRRKFDELYRAPTQLSLMTRTQLVADYCYFYRARVIGNDGDSLRDSLVKTVALHAEHFPRHQQYLQRCMMGGGGGGRGDATTISV